MVKTPETNNIFSKDLYRFLDSNPISKSGNIDVFVILDHFSKFPFLKKVKKFTVHAIIPFME